MKVAIVAEFYPRRHDPVLGVWAHRQALAARDAGAEVRVLVLHRLLPPQSALAAGPGQALAATRRLLAQPHRELRDGIEVVYVRYASPPRARHYQSWGAWAAPALGVALRTLRRRFDFELIHAHNAVPAADAVRHARLGAALAISVHGGDVLYTAPRSDAGRVAVERNLGAAATVLANSSGIAELARHHGAHDTRVVHLGSDLPAPRAGRAAEAEADAQARGPALRWSHSREPRAPSLVTVGHLVARKRHADVLRALAVLAPRHPTLRYEIVGDGPERVALEGLAARLGVGARVGFHGQLPHERATALARECTLFAMPSTEEAFGVAYVEAMAGGVPAIGCRGEPGPEEIAAAGDGFVLVPPGDVERLTQRIEELLGDPHRLREASRRARETVAAHFTWELCGEQTVAAYEHAVRVAHAERTSQ
ncbi:MAG TPA: glycosyltransferase [Solirubrobacteraceae bacterium]|nr:glycosyltransferase [Solirubrobacteraceae bacterium]